MTDQTTTRYVQRALAAKQRMAEARIAREQWVFDAAEAPDLIWAARQIRRQLQARAFAFGLIAGLIAGAGVL